MKDSNKKWTSRKEAFFGLHFDLHPGKNDTELGAHITEDMIAGLMEKVQPDYVQYDCKGHAGYTGYPTAHDLPYTVGSYPNSTRCSVSRQNHSGCLILKAEHL